MVNNREILRKMKTHVQYLSICAFLFFIIAFTGCSGCGNSGYVDSDMDTYVSIEGDDNEQVDGRGGYDDDNSGNPSIGNIRLTGRIETCNKCMGYGSVQDGLHGQPQICKFCWISTNMRVQQGWTGFDGRYGQVDAVFNTLPADYFDGLDWNESGGYDDNGGGNGNEQIESEIARHEENIAQLEHKLEYIEGTINRTQIQQQIIEEQYEIRRLKAMLNN